MKKRISIGIAICCMCIIIALLPGMILGGVFDSPPSKNTIKNIFSDDYHNLENIVDYLYELEVSDTHIILNDLDESKMTDDIIKTFDILKKQGYSSISKNNNTISFVRWSKRDFGSGFVYSTDEKFGGLEFLTYIEELSYNNWYYYEEDFNKWKQQNKE